MTYTHYCWIAMRRGELLSAMYTHGAACESPEVVQATAKPIAHEADAYALVRVETIDDEYSETSNGPSIPCRKLLRQVIIEIVPRT